MTAAAGLFAALILVTPAAAQAAPYPTRPIMLVVEFTASGGTNIIARLIGPKLAEEIGQAIVIENRAGASGTIAAASVARAAPDGVALLMGHVSSNAMVPAVLKVRGKGDRAVAVPPLHRAVPIACLLTICCLIAS